MTMSGPESLSMELVILVCRSASATRLTFTSTPMLLPASSRDFCMYLVASGTQCCSRTTVMGPSAFPLPPGEGDPPEQAPRRASDIVHARVTSGPLRRNVNRLVDGFLVLVCCSMSTSTFRYIQGVLAGRYGLKVISPSVTYAPSVTSAQGHSRHRLRGWSGLDQRISTARPRLPMPSTPVRALPRRIHRAGRTTTPGSVCRGCRGLPLRGRQRRPRIVVTLARLISLLSRRATSGVSLWASAWLPGWQARLSSFPWRLRDLPWLHRS